MVLYYTSALNAYQKYKKYSTAICTKHWMSERVDLGLNSNFSEHKRPLYPSQANQAFVR